MSNPSKNLTAVSAFVPAARKIFDVLELESDVAVGGKRLFYRAKYRRKA